MMRFWRCSNRSLLLALAVAPLGCTRHQVEVKPTHHTVEVKPIYLTVDVNIRVQKELDRFFEDVEPPRPDQEGEER